MRHLCTALWFVPAILAAQEPVVPAKSFLIDDYRSVAFVDLKAMRDRGIWADLEVSVLKVVFQQMEKEIGFPLAALDRTTMVADLGARDAPEEVLVRSIREVLVLEGNRPLGLPASVEHGDWQQAAVGKHTVRRRTFMRPETFVQPRPELQVRGATDVVEPALEGKPHVGLPCADIMSLLSGRGDNLLYMVFDVDNVLLREKALGVLFPGAKWPEGDAPTFLFCRVRATGDADDPHLEVEAVLRHAKEGPGLAVSGTAADEWVERMKKDPTMRAVRPLLLRMEKKLDHADLVLRADLGRTREAVGYLAALAMPLLGGRSMQAQVQEEREVPAPPPPPPEPKKKAL